MKVKKLLNEIWKSGLIPLILGFYIYFNYTRTSFFVLSLILLFIGLILGYNYTKPKEKTIDEASKRTDPKMDVLADEPETAKSVRPTQVKESEREISESREVH